MKSQAYRGSVKPDSLGEKVKKVPSTALSLSLLLWVLFQRDKMDGRVTPWHLWSRVGGLWLKPPGAPTSHSHSQSNCHHLSSGRGSRVSAPLCPQAA